MQIASLWKRAVVAGGIAFTVRYGVVAIGQTSQLTPKELVETMISRECTAHQSNVRYSYLSEERSDRTGGHLWTERMVETAWGTVRYLIAIDGKALTPDQTLVEKLRLKVQTSNPESYQKEEIKLDESEHSQQLLAVLPKAFLFETLDGSAQEIRIGYRPDPGFTPQTMEQRALYGMTGVVVLDAKTLRLHRLEGQAPKDVSLGFGPFAVLRAGSNFATEREQMDGAVWKTASVRTSIQGRALLLKTVARQQEYRHSDFHRVPASLALGAAVAFAER